MSKECLECGSTDWFDNGYFGVEQVYCSNACRQKAYRKRKKALCHDHGVTHKK